MARYISTQELQQTINDIVTTTTRLVAILPFETVQSKKLFEKWNLVSNSTLEFSLVLSGPFSENPSLTPDAVESILQLQSVRIVYHDGPLISRILTDSNTLLLPNGLTETQSEKAGVLSKLGIDQQDDLTKIESQSRLVYKKVAHFKSKFFGLKKTFDKSSVVENTLGLEPNRS